MKDKTPNFQKTIEKLKKECTRVIKETNVPGLSMALVSGNKVIWSEGFGHTDKTKTNKVDENTRFAYQSTGKSIVSAITMKAVQDGLIELDNPLVKYYPEFNVKSIFEEGAREKITFRHLLSHTAGIQEGIPPGIGFNEKGEINDPTYEERIESLQNSWLRFPVGERPYYSNFGIDLVTYGLQRASGKRYPDYVKESFAHPMGMTSIEYDREVALSDSNTARGYLGANEAVIRDSSAYGAGMPFLSIKDLATFARFLLNKGTIDGKTIVQEEYLEEMFKGDYSEDYFDGILSTFSNSGLCIFLNSINDVIKVLHHPGGAFGYTSNMVIIPECDIGVIALANSEYSDPTKNLSNIALKSMLKEMSIKIEEIEIVDKREDSAVEVDVEKLKNLEGFYSSVGGSELLVQYKEGKLYMGSHELTPHDNDEFSSERLKILRFELDEQGIPKKLTFLHVDRGWWPAYFIKRYDVDREEPTRKGWDEYMGLYTGYYYGIERFYFTIIRREDHLVEKSKDGEVELYESKAQPGLFITFHGISYEFKKDYLLIGHVKMFRCKEPVKELLKLEKLEPTHRHLNTYNLQQLESMLRHLEREEEANTIKELKDRLHPK